jgi:CarD family transcriptional regulator
MQSGGLLPAAEVLKSLLILQSQKPLSFREKKMLERARHMLVSEVAIVRRLSEIDAEDVLQKSLAKASLCLPERALAAGA